MLLLAFFIISDVMLHISAHESLFSAGITFGSERKVCDDSESAAELLTGEAAHCGHDDDEDDDAAAAGGVCWPEPSLSVWLTAVLSSAWVWFLQSGVPLAGN